MLWRYGFNFLRMQMWVEGVLDKFMRWGGEKQLSSPPNLIFLTRRPININTESMFFVLLALLTVMWIFFLRRIYQYQQYGYSFSSVERLLHAMGGDSFLTLMNQTLEEAMMGEGFSQVFLNDIVAPITRVNYGQSVRINGFVGMFYNVRVWIASSYVIIQVFCWKVVK